MKAQTLPGQYIAIEGIIVSKDERGCWLFTVLANGSVAARHTDYFEGLKAAGEHLNFVNPNYNPASDVFVVGDVLDGVDNYLGKDGTYVPRTARGTIYVTLTSSPRAWATAAHALRYAEEHGYDSVHRGVLFGSTLVMGEPSGF